MINIELIKLEELPDEFRTLYLNSLPEPQELLLELLVCPWEELERPTSNKYFIKNNQINIGYIIISTKNILLEFFLINEYIPLCEEIFKLIIEKLLIKKVYCKSFDFLLLKCCITFYKSIKIKGVLFRDIINKNIELPLPNISVRLGDPQDFAKILIFKKDFFECEGEIRYFLENKKLILFFIENEILGCGIFSRTIKNRPDYDIGMVVHPKYRRKGFGAYIINYLKEYCYKNNFRPTCGCAFENIASRRTLEKAGFISKHNLLVFTF